MDDVHLGEDLEDKDTAFTWEVKANSRAYNKQFRKKGFLWWRQKKYKSNAIHTAKYNFFSFLPLNLYEQFRHTSNLYFLLIIILQSFPEISTLPWFTLFAPLVCLLVIRATRDLVDDIGRHRSDNIINNRPCQILRGKSFLWKKWKNLCVGDVVCLSKDSIVPADMLLLASTEPSSLCYVETADIDGETNLKFRQALMVTHHELTSPKKMASFQGTVICEEPNSRMHHFVGSLEWNNRKYPLDIGNLLLRGCRIRNTDTCYGLVIYAGLDTKIMMNCGKIHLKRTKLDMLMNKLVILIFMSMVVVSLLLTLGFTFMVKEFKGKHYYLFALHKRTEAMESFFIFWGFLILLSVMVPMAMFISAEFIYLGNSFFINWDLSMYYEPLDMPAKARNTSLNDQLGQVQYIFSDKTGTLTQNVMTFKKCCINGCIYDSDDEHGTLRKRNPYAWNPFADGKLQFYNKELESLVRGQKNTVVQEFWRLLAICHTVMVQEKDNQLLYQAASPDEEALVTAARNFGYVFLSRTQDTITLVELGEERVYQVLAMMDFNSDRKRMSVLVRNPEGSICLYTKGADTVILERLHKKGAMEETTEEILASFAEQTLRTLCLAYKKVEEEDYKRWEPKHLEASLLLQNRAQALHQVYNKIEQNLQLLGVTAIEDKLQDGVPETINCLKKGNIKMWVLTGDKPETAVNIGFACKLLSENMLIMEDKDINRLLENYCRNEREQQRAFKVMTHQNMALVINGDFLDQLLLSLRKEPRALVQNAVVDEVPQDLGLSKMDFLKARRISQMWRNIGSSLTQSSSVASKIHESLEVQRERAFVDLASKCQAVICCRVTPKQKALVVALVKKYQQVVTLAIGDGANDVNMIKTADIGVGLAGQEGMQAVQNSDYVLAQFCYLQRLLLVHGRWSYMRVCKFLRYFFYKTVASMMAQIWFSMFNGFTAQPLYEGWFLALFNLLYSTLPVLYIGLFEQDMTAEKSLKMPELYEAGQKDELFNYSIFLQAIVHGILTSFINFFMPLVVSGSISKSGASSDHQSFGVLVAISGLLSITLEVILVIKYWTLLCVSSIVLSLCSYIIVTSLIQSLWLYKISPKTFPFLFADYNVLSQPTNLLVIILNVTVNTIPVLAFRMIHGIVVKLRLKEKEEEVPSEEVSVEPAMKHLRRGLPGRRSSYAFSHREGYADLITQGTILRRNGEFGGDTIFESPNESEEDLPSARKESIFNPRKISILAKTKRQHHGKGSQEESRPNASSQTQATQHSDTKKPVASTSALSLQPSSSDDQAFHSVTSEYTLASQQERLDVRASSWRELPWKDSASSKQSQLEVPTKKHSHSSS
ncbi:phospholipid-transporting ATPase IK [Cricetulus griseus]|uniref:Phospholipid-transporting ATPase n=1 Tax=Cricetulus griseus TaxID=10029 RepID=A0A061I578_CRIGR|nr:phospholipid-transporting ATPase IK [Cricetulus griseus]XP_027292499.1 phospholipid-transporting ATPase IK [Cricetulus griseus]ERE72428.1 putative phospholipid-transporting ATPase IK-like protein [Cricetulus griseus]